jgi:FKBP-type peptidyl-prolyl cis-trans isomerase 2
LLKGYVEPETMDFVTGYLHVIPGLERRLIGHHVGEKLSFAVPAEEAFGPRREDLIIEKAKADFHFPQGVNPSVGMEIPLVAATENAPETVTIREVRDYTILIDLNHPLAGMDLQYDLEILEARPARPTDVCAEWDQQRIPEAWCPSVPQIVLGHEPTEED